MTEYLGLTSCPACGQPASVEYLSVEADYRDGFSPAHLGYETIVRCPVHGAFEVDEQWQREIEAELAREETAEYERTVLRGSVCANLPPDWRKRIELARQAWQEAHERSRGKPILAGTSLPYPRRQ